jgi:formate dehydrogenase maturation protein FdhE
MVGTPAVPVSPSPWFCSVVNLEQRPGDFEHKDSQSANHTYRFESYSRARIARRREQQMIDNEALSARLQDTQRRCPVCAAVPRLAQTILDIRNGKTVRLLQCQCGERIWDD